MGSDPPSPHVLMPPPPLSIPKSNLAMFNYDLIVVGTAAIVLVLYNLIIIRWCRDASDHNQSRQRVSTRRLGPTSSRSFHNLNTISYVSSFKYFKKDGVTQDDYECVVCLSVFEEGEELKQLPKCNHSFHAPCIDMWLYSHIDCPLCRSPVEPPVLQLRAVTQQSEHSREGLLGPGTLV